VEKPSWAPFVVGGAFPREFTDLLVIAIIGLAGLQAYLTRFTVGGVELGFLTLFLTVLPTCTLASLSNATRKLREELALFAYGGSAWQVWAKHFLRGFTCSLIALSPFLSLEIITTGYSVGSRSLLLVLAAVLGGTFYSGPSLRRVRSAEFAVSYKA